MGRFEDQQRYVDAQNRVDPIPDDISITELAEQVVRGKRKLSQPQMRMLIELLPYYAPKLTAVAVGYLKPGFAERLEDAINRSERAKVVRMIEGQVVAEEE